jgi:hypothetical protein
LNHKCPPKENLSPDFLAEKLDLGKNIRRLGLVLAPPPRTGVHAGEFSCREFSSRGFADGLNLPEESNLRQSVFQQAGAIKATHCRSGSFFKKTVVFLKVKDRREVARKGDRLAAAGTVRPSTDGFAEASAITNHVGALTGVGGHTSALPHCSFNGEVHTNLLSLTFECARGVAEFFPGLIVMV